MYSQNVFVEKDMALVAPTINYSPGDEYSDKRRKWQGIPGIERSLDGTLWVSFYSGGDTEGSDNYVTLIKSSDDGNTWSEPILVIDPPGKVRAFDPCLWIDPQGKLWLFWAQSYTFFDGRVGVWTSICSNPNEADMVWSKPRRIANGIMMNKPTILTTGEWLLPCAIWTCENSNLNCVKEECFSNVYISKNKGDSFELYGKADIPNRWYDEHMIIERKDNSLWMLVRTKYGVGESISIDKGKTWSPGKVTTIEGPNARFFIRRLKSGNLLLVNHYNFDKRNNLTAMISEDDGITWKGFLLLDERNGVSYPDGIETMDGEIYIIYDRERNVDKEILMAVFTEADVLAGRVITEKARLKVLVNKA